MMFCAHLSLANFRNYSRLELDLPPGVSVVVGDNGQGKSNLLEALYFLAMTKSFRATSDRELISWRSLGGDLAFTRLVARVERDLGHAKLEAVIREDGRAGDAGAPAPAVSKRLKLNDVPRRAIEFVGAVNVVMFSPQDIELVDGPPVARRRYLDVTISQVDPRYIRTLAHYNKVLVQRNHLLRGVRERRARADQLFPWDHELVGAGAFLVQQRRATLARLAELAADIHRELTGLRQQLEIVYRPSFDLAAPDLGPEPDVEALQTAFRLQLRAAQGREIASGTSILGPHRDDLVFLVDGRDMNVFGSRGQQRTVALALKLAEAEFLCARAGERPILLLDDVLSELDEPRRRHVLRSIAPDQQVLCTATDTRAFDPEFLERATAYRVQEGAIAALSAV